MTQPFQRLLMILCGFSDEKIVKSQQNPKNIQKSPKYNLKHCRKSYYILRRMQASLEDATHIYGTCDNFLVFL